LSGPSPLYQPNFPTEFIAQARLLLRRRTAKAHLRQRASLALLLHYQSELSNVEAAEQVGLHPNSVRLWRKRWAQGVFEVEDQPGRGRKPTFSPSGPRPGQGSGL
jgi:DNA-directed RNA polymerase specialized sigma24 family protein